MPSFSQSPRIQTFGGSGSAGFRTTTVSMRGMADSLHGSNWPEAWAWTRKKSRLVGQYSQEFGSRVTGTSILYARVLSGSGSFLSHGIVCAYSYGSAHRGMGATLPMDQGSSLGVLPDARF